MFLSIDQFKSPFFIGVAGAGMSAIAQYLAGVGKQVSGSDRFFAEGVYNETRSRLEDAGITCYVQDGSGLNTSTDLVVVSTAIEETVYEVQKARELGIPIMTRSQVLAIIAASKKTIAIGGTSGKSTTCAMLFEILHVAGLEPGIISGAGLVRIINEGKIGNACVGNGDFLVIEADESDGSIVNYHPYMGVLLNVDKDHKEMDELVNLFEIFKNNSQIFIVNSTHAIAQKFSQLVTQDFSIQVDAQVGYVATGFKQDGLHIKFFINETPFTMQVMGAHNMENALAATCVAAQLGVPLETCSKALEHYQGIYRRQQVVGEQGGVMLIDDYAHNPVKCVAAIRACQPLAAKVVAWFQPHGYGPTRFLRQDYCIEFVNALRPQDELWMSEIFYAGGTAQKDISAADLVDDVVKAGGKAYFVPDRNDFFEQVKTHLAPATILLLMGARDPSLEQYASIIWNKMKEEL